ncbi:MAG: hypothetical protein IJ649_02650 [Oscillospiraceae bacterium]|nr:hypothetical protein [Oscillospiraceae bacterium]
MATTPKASPKVSSTIGLKNFVIAPLTKDDETGHTYGEVQAVAGAIEATITPNNTDPDVQYADDIEFDTLYPDPEIDFNITTADLPLEIQALLFSQEVDGNGVLIRTANQEPQYFACGFKSEKADHTFRYVWLYKVRAKPLTEEYGTKEGTTITRRTQQTQFTAIKRTHDGQYQAVADEGQNGFTAEKAATFLDTVYEKAAAAGG